MRTVGERVAEWHRVFGLPVTAPPDRVELNLRLLREEVDEAEEALRSGDLIHASLELADVVFVAFETGATYGMPVDAALDEVIRANMSKLGADGRPLLRADGKILKGPNFRPPRRDRLSLLLGA